MAAFFRWHIDPIPNLQNLKQGLQNKAQRIAMNAAASPVKAIAVAQAPSDTGALKKSMRIKVKQYKDGNRWVAIVGPKSDFTKKKKKKVRRPARYNYLLNKGTRNMSGKHHMDSASKEAGRVFFSRYLEKLREVIPTLIKS